MALSKHESDREISNLARIARIICSPCTDILRDVLKSKITLSDLRKEVRFYHSYEFHNCEFLIQFQHIISKQKYSDFDIPMLYVSLRLFCGIPSHKKKWGNFPEEKDSSLSANIERIYCIHKKYRQFPKDDLDDSNFEQEWKSVFQTVKELEKHLGPGTKHQDTLKSLKICSMEKDVERIFIEHLRVSRNRLHFIYPSPFHSVPLSETVSADTPDTMASERELEKEVLIHETFPHLFISESDSDHTSDTMASERELEKEVLIHKTFPHLFISESDSDDTTDIIPSMRNEHITSELLKKVFNSFKVEIPADVPGHKSFAREILEDDIRELVAAIKSLSDEIVLTKPTYPTEFYMPQVEACVFEVEVVYNGDGDEEKFIVIGKDTSLDRMFRIQGDTRIRVILIRSNSLPVVSSKLIVYKNFKNVINEKGFFLQHEYEEFDDVAKLIANQMVVSFCTSIESVINAFTANLYESLIDFHGKPLTAENVQKICANVFEGTVYKPFGFMKSTRYLSSMVASFIKTELSEDKLVGRYAWNEVQNACRNTVEDLKVILSGLEKFQTDELHVDQTKQIEEWMRREVIRDRSALKMHTSIIKYISGYRGDKKPVVKVYLHGDDKKAEEDFKNCCEVSKDTHFEFVNVERSKEKNKEVEQLKLLERKAPAIDNATRKKLKQIIQDHGDKIYARHSNVVGIRIGKARWIGNSIQEEPCIVLYCLDKYIIPFGENSLPGSIEGWPCDIREDIVRFGRCPNESPVCRQNFPDPGCSIGIPSVNSSGSVGFLVESTNPLQKFKCGFLTASHVAIEHFEKLYHNGRLLSMLNLHPHNHFILHPWIENGINDHVVGKVIESFCGNYGLEKIGLDFALVANKYCRNEAGKEILTVAKEDDLRFEEDIVTKTGKTTGRTKGYLMDNSLTVKVDKSFLSRGYFAFFNCYAIEEDNTESQPFFLKGDSGSGVYVIEDGKPTKPLGIAFAYLDSQTAVCNIGTIVDKLNLQIVRYLEHEQKSKSKELNLSEEKTEEPMEYS